MRGCTGFRRAGDHQDGVNFRQRVAFHTCSSSQRRVWFSQLLQILIIVQMLCYQVMVVCAFSDTASARIGGTGHEISYSPFLPYEYTMKSSVERGCKAAIARSDEKHGTETKHSGVHRWDTVRGYWQLSDKSKKFMNSTGGSVFLSFNDFGNYSSKLIRWTSIRLDLRPWPVPIGYDISASVNAEGMYFKNTGELCLIGCSRLFQFVDYPTYDAHAGSWGVPLAATNSSAWLFPSLEWSLPSLEPEVNVSGNYSDAPFSFPAESNTSLWYNESIGFFRQTLDCRSDDCDVTVVFKLKPKTLISRARFQGIIKSLCNNSDYSAPIKLDLEVIDPDEYHKLEIIRERIESIGLMIELVCTLFQLLYMTFRPERVPWMSVSMVVLHGGIRLIRWSQNLFLPFVWNGMMVSSEGRNSSYMPFELWMTTSFPFVLELCILTFLGAFILLIWRARRQLRARTAMNGEEASAQLPPPTEWPVMVVCFLLHGSGAFAAFMANVFSDLYELMRDYFLLPQVLANIIWDSKGKAPLHPIYTTGSTLVPLAELIFAYHWQRTLSMEDRSWTEGSRTWLVCNLVGMPLLLCFLHLQQSSWGGRWFLPRRWSRRQHTLVTEEEISLVEKPGAKECSSIERMV